MNKKVCIMKIRIQGEMRLSDIERAIVEVFAELEENYRVRHSQGATIYLNPTNGFGHDVKPLTGDGHELVCLSSKGPTRSAAEEYNLL